MREPRNPFKMPTAERIESDETFLRLFAHGMLDLVPEDGMSRNLTVLRSSPGGGKTSLLRLLRPSCLRSLMALGSNEDCRELYKKASAMKLIGSDGPRVLGIHLSMRKSNYAVIEDTGLNEAQKHQLFFSLLNSRIVIAYLKAVSDYNELPGPSQLTQLRNLTELGQSLNGATYSSAGELFDSACQLELSLVRMLSSFEPPAELSASVSEELPALRCLTLPSEVSASQDPTPLVLLDDVHKLSSKQRSALLHSVVENRFPIAVWCAERYELLSGDELLATGATAGREYGLVDIEEYWRNKKTPSKFFEIAGDKRVRATRELQLSSFEGCLQQYLSGKRTLQKLDEATSAIKERIQKLTQIDQSIEVAYAATTDPYERALKWRTLEIVIARDKSKGQLGLGLGISKKARKASESTSVQEAAKLFLSLELKIPYCFGLESVVKLGTDNIQQFIAMGADLFEEVLSSAVVGDAPTLSAVRQQQILKALCKQKWNEIPHRVQGGRDAQRLLLAFKSFAQQRTYLVNAPYPPGVTGFALSPAECDRLAKIPKGGEENKVNGRLAAALRACLTESLLTVRTGVSQGKAGQTWNVFYLNRWLCLHFNLPLGYGGYQKLTSRRLSEWLEFGYTRKTDMANLPLTVDDDE